VIGAAVRQAREELGWSQNELAESVGITRTSITNLEHGRQQTPLHVLYAIADRLGVSIKELLPDDQAWRESRQRTSVVVVYDPDVIDRLVAAASGPNRRRSA
jgi:transcriptional regulator with XRE-family HTH domain